MLSFGIFGVLNHLKAIFPQAGGHFNLNHMWVHFVTTRVLAYLAFSVPSGKLIEKIG